MTHRKDSVITSQVPSGAGMHGAPSSGRILRLYATVLALMLMTPAATAEIWEYTVDAPAAPVISSTMTLTSPSLARLQSEIDPGVKIVVKGTVSISSGQTLSITDDDVWLDFTLANPLAWSGSDTATAFIEVNADRVKLQGLDFSVSTSSAGRCRGIHLDACADVLITGCQLANTADGIFADDDFVRVAIENTDLTNCADWTSSSLQGGHGLYFDEGDASADHLRVSNVNASLALSSLGHGIKLFDVTQILIEDCAISGSGQYSLWSCGVQNMAVQDTTFYVGGVRFGANLTDALATSSTSHVRLSDSVIEHNSTSYPLELFCSQIVSDLKIRDCSVISSTSSYLGRIAYRDDPDGSSPYTGENSTDINWLSGSLIFNETATSGCGYWSISSDWNECNLQLQNIGPVSDFAIPSVGCTPDICPDAAITVMRTSGEVPFTVHVHALDGDVGIGLPETARFVWNFGDTGSDFNELEGFNAAHTYDTTGTKTITLTTTNEDGVSHQRTVKVTASTSSRTVYYVSPSGSDTNNGLSTLTPIQTVAKVQTLMGNNKEFSFERGGTYTANATLTINNTNVVLSAYGAGSRPILYSPDIPGCSLNGDSLGVPIIDANASELLTIQDLKIDSADSTPSCDTMRGMSLEGEELTVRRCHFDRLGDAIHADANGLLTQANIADFLGEYYWIGSGSNIVHVGNVVEDSNNQHAIRGGDLLRIMIAHNDLACPTSSKSSVWLMFGQYGYVVDNIAHASRMLCGPNFDPAVSFPAERMQHVVFESNHLIEEGFIAYSGAEDIWYRNNVVEFSGGLGFSIWGYLSPPLDRTTKRVHVHNNTVQNFSDEYGKYVQPGDGAEDVEVANSLYHAPELHVPGGSAFNVDNQDDNLDEQSYTLNLWALPTWGDYVHRIDGNAVTQVEWAVYPQTIEEMYRQWFVSDLDANFEPQFNAELGLAIPGVHRDFQGNLRPLSGTVTVGAIEE